MAKSKPAYSESKEDWEAHDAMHTMMRASEIVKDKKLMARVKKKAAEHADKMREVADRAGSLAKRGLISQKAMAKMKGNKGQGGDAKELAKAAPLAKGTEGDSPSRTNAGVTYR